MPASTWSAVMASESRSRPCARRRPNPRSTIGVLQPDYDVLLAIRLDADYKPVEAIEASKEVVERHFGRGRVTWTKTFAADDAVQEITAEQLLGH